MAQSLLHAAPLAANHCPIIPHQNEDSSWATNPLQPRNVSATTTRKAFDKLSLGQQESTTASENHHVDESASKTKAATAHSTSNAYTPTHHLNFFGHPVYHKCATPPATSLAIIMSQKQGILDADKDLHKAAIMCEALPLLEPVVYWGPHDILTEHKGTALKEAVTGRCAKLYTNDGIWHDDKRAEDEDMPLNYDDTAKTDVLFDGYRSYDISPSAQDLLRRLQLSGHAANDVERYNQRRAQCAARPGSPLREVVCASDLD